MSNRKKTGIVRNELNVLADAIDYAQAQIGPLSMGDRSDLDLQVGANRSRQQSAYEEFLRVAWGKAIRIKSDKLGRQIYRLSQASAVIVGAGSNVATPSSSIGRLVSIAQAGQTRESSFLGEYTIEDVWFFERYRGTEYRQQIKNFARMIAHGSLAFTVENLRAWLDQCQTHAPAEELAGLATGPARPARGTPASSSEEFEDASINEGESVEEVSIWESVQIHEPETSDEPAGQAMSASASRDTDTISLAPNFYVNFSEKQYDAAHWGANGLVYVEGVAGSGKTSVALGRTKALAQLGQLSTNDPNYNPFFAEETQLGVVRTAELINYLRSTCDALSLHRFPIAEFAGIRETLRNHWKLGESGSRGRRWTFEAAPTGSTYCVSVAELKAVASATLSELRSHLANSLSDWRPGAASEKIDGDVFERIRRETERAIASVPEPANAIGFFSRWTKHIKAALREVGAARVWVGVPTKTGFEWSLDHRNGLVEHLFRPGESVCFSRSPTSFEFLLPPTTPEHWSQHLPPRAELRREPDGDVNGKARIWADDGQEVEITVRVVSEEDLVLRLPNTKIRYFDGIRPGNLTLRSREVLIVDLREGARREEKSTAQSWARTVIQRVQSRINRRAAAVDILDLYPKALAAMMSHGKLTQQQAAYAERIERLERRILDTDDIDVLLAMLATLTYADPGSSESDFRYLPPPYHTAIFIDEVQDFAPAEILLLTLLASPKHSSVTVVGDPAQRLRPLSNTIDSAIPRFLWRTGHVETLRDNVRQQSAPALRDLSAAFRYTMIDAGEANPAQVGSAEQVVFRESAPALEMRARRVLEALAELSQTETVVVLTASDGLAQALADAIGEGVFGQLHRHCAFSSTLDLSKRYLIHVSTPRHVKGLEFEHTVLCGLEDFNLSEEHEVNALYVALSRPTRSLQVIGERRAIGRRLMAIIDAACG